MFYTNYFFLNFKSLLNNILVLKVLLKCHKRTIYRVKKVFNSVYSVYLDVKEHKEKNYNVCKNIS